jgi:hypothetical protein
MTIKTIIAMGTLLFSTHSFALFCPTNFSLINMGDSLETVEKTCGKPASQTTTTSDKNVPQEWTYYETESVYTNVGTPAEGTLRMVVAFVNNQAINISVNGIGVGSTAICQGTIALGSASETVLAACGKPSFVNKQQPSELTPSQIIKTTVFNYNSNPPMKLIFINGKLSGKE